MGNLIQGDDGLIAEEVHEWIKDKHSLMCYYLGIAKGVRKKSIAPGEPGATYIDVFCGTGRAQIAETGEWVDGGAVAAWKASKEGGAPFSKIYIADLDEQRRSACADRLSREGAPFEVIEGDAVTAAQKITALLNRYALHFAFIDPYSLGTLDFRIIEQFSKLRRMDMLIHVSAMDLNRNTWQHKEEDKAFDSFAPGWREHVSMPSPYWKLKSDVVQHWRTRVAGLGKWTSTQMKLIKGQQNQPLYWLLLASGSELAHRFWKYAIKAEKRQDDFGF